MSDIYNLQTLLSTKSLNNSLFNYIYSIYEPIDLIPNREHRISTIEYTDIMIQTQSFIEELINSAITWVYNIDKQKQLIDEKFHESGDLGSAYSFLVNHAKNKFRIDRPQGQFGELLLFNFLQKFFDSIPLVRKMPITTSVGLERFGADAIHVGFANDSPILYLGEAKCYTSSYKFNAALQDSIDSIFKTFDNLSSELSLYMYDDFIEEDLKKFADDFKNNKVRDLRFELVNIVIYNETSPITKTTEIDIKNEIVNIVKERCKSFDKGLYSNYNSIILNRLHYILFPIWKLDEILNQYKDKF